MSDHLLQKDQREPTQPAELIRDLPWSPGRVHWMVIVLYLGAHAAFGMFADLSPPPVATLHAIVVPIIAFWLVGVRRNAEAVACIATYVAACDVLWRMTGASVPWELSKILLILILLVAIVRIVRRPLRIGLPLLFLALLVPSAMVTVERFGILGGGRERLSFVLGAHLVLVLAVIFFSNLRVERQRLAGILWMLVGPVLAVNTIATAGTVGLEASDFVGDLSNRAASGGYGPNQVSALIGVGAMACIFLVLLDRRPVLRFAAAGLAVWFLAQSALTFSRGGTFNLLVALIVTIPFFLRTAQMAVRFFAVALVVGLVIAFVMIPAIQHITGNEFGHRFTSSDPTLRTDLMRAETEIWSENVALGIGVGMEELTISDQGATTRGEYPKTSSHTEYTRLLAEHGVLGLFALITLFAIAVRSVRSQVLPLGKVFSVFLMAWCATEVGHSATRLALSGFLFGLAAVVIVENGALLPRSEQLDDVAEEPRYGQALPP
jgi:hypothetical protein